MQSAFQNATGIARDTFEAGHYNIYIISGWFLSVCFAPGILSEL